MAEEQPNSSEDTGLIVDPVVAAYVILARHGDHDCEACVKSRRVIATAKSDEETDQIFLNAPDLLAVECIAGRKDYCNYCSRPVTGAPGEKWVTDGPRYVGYCSQVHYDACREVVACLSERNQPKKKVLPLPL